MNDKEKFVYLDLRRKIPESELLEALYKNGNVYSRLADKIAKQQKLDASAFATEPLAFFVEPNVNDDSKGEFIFSDNKPNSFEEDVCAYLELLREAGVDDLDPTLLLPDPGIRRYGDVIQRLIIEMEATKNRALESARRCKLSGEEELADIYCDDALETAQKIDFLRDALNNNNYVVEQDDEYPINLIFIPTTPNYEGHYMCKEIKDIPNNNRYYGIITNLLTCIQRGEFEKKGERLYEYDNRLNTMKYWQIRIPYVHLEGNTYVVLGVKVKKTTVSHEYYSFLGTSYDRFQDWEDELRRCLNNPDFISLQEYYRSCVFKQLIGSKEDDNMNGKGGVQNVKNK